MTAARWTATYIALAALMAAILGLLVLAVPQEDGVRDWTGPLIQQGWMAWTFPVALFFWIIACLLITMMLLAIRWPETPRVGALRIETTRGDRLFISLLGSGFISMYTRPFINAEIQAPNVTPSMFGSTHPRIWASCR